MFDNNSSSLKPLKCFPEHLEKQLLVDHFKTFTRCYDHAFRSHEEIQIYHQLQTAGFAVVNPNSDLNTFFEVKKEYIDHDVEDCTNLLKNTNENVGYLPSNSHYDELISYLFSKNYVLNNTFTSIFGENNWELTTSQLFSASRSKLSTQDRPSPYFWHRDSVGRRFKVWIVLEQNSSSPDTWILANSNIQDPIPRQWEMWRANSDFKSNQASDFTRIVSGHRDFVVIKYSLHDIVIVDTNSIHKGDYSPSKISPCSPKSRVFLEISVRSKATGAVFDKLNGIPEKARVKVGSTIKHLFSPSHLVS